MPGINLISVKDRSSDLAAKFAKVQLNMKHDLNYKTGVFVENDHTMVGYTGYDEYPIRSLENDDYLAIIEGMIYNISGNEVDSFISDVLLQNRHGSIPTDDVEDFLLNSDGEFVIAIYDKLSSDLIILNDVFGRLPLYYFEDGQQFIVSREVKFITEFISNVNFDELAIADYLLFGYPLGKRTLVKDVKRLDPAVLLEHHRSSWKLGINRVHIWNCEKKSTGISSPMEHAHNLAKLFRDATRCRVESLNGFKNLVSLSGGLDSRAVAIALKEADPKSTSVTFLDYDGKASEDVDVARTLVQRLHFDWKLIKLKKRAFEDAVRLIYMKDGLNSAGMGYILDFFVQIKHTFGNKVVYYTGDGGDKALPCLRAAKEVKSMNELIDLIIDEQAGAFEINKVVTLSKISLEQIRDEIKNTLVNFPENDLNQKYVHFVLFERGYKRNFEGEDRNRFYFWSTSPFWSPKLFDYSMKIPDSYKKHLSLYRTFLERLDKNCLRIRYANWRWAGMLPGTLSYYFLPRIQEAVFQNSLLRKRIEKTTKLTVRAREDEKYSPNERIRNYKAIHVPSYLGKSISLYDVERLVNITLSERKFYALVSIILYAQVLENKNRRGACLGSNRLMDRVEGDHPPTTHQ